MLEKYIKLVVLILQALELLSSIALLESAILKLEEEFISLHFQVSQERNERRLTEYRWRHSSEPLFVFSDVVKASVNTLFPLSLSSLHDHNENSHYPSQSWQDKF